MGQSAEWWREYRRRNADRLREYNRQRKKQPKVRAQRRASELRRRAHKRQVNNDFAIPASYTGHEVFEQAMKLVGPPSYFERQDWEDRMGAVVLELLERGRKRQPKKVLYEALREQARFSKETELWQAIRAS